MAETVKRLIITSEVPAEQRRADRVVQSLTGASRRRTQGLFDQQCVRRNGAVCVEPWRWLDDADVIEVRYEETQRYAAVKRPPKHLGFEVLFEDKHLIVVVKPAAWLTVPSPKRETNTLVQRVAEYLTKRNRGRRVWTWAVQRLDRGVSGVLVLGREEAAANALRQQFAAHEPRRRYVAIVAGRLATDRGEFRSRLGSGDDLRQRSVGEDQEGLWAVTRYVVARRLPDTTLVYVELETGRRNQIRVHFAEAGHPILGDKLYAPQAAKHPRWPHDRLALHAQQLGFTHPLTGQTLEFQTPLPDEFEDFLEGTGEPTAHLTDSTNE
jgi:23S rRNA pseudouridine1911/1915/1917 synthase